MSSTAGRKLFSFPHGQLHLHPEGLELIRAAGDLRMVAIVGVGRAGKSCLGNALLGSSAFTTGNGGEAVTDGVDVALEGKQLVMDCEGLNNALAASRPQVLMLGAALASTLIFVLDGQLSEPGLDMLAGLVAELQLSQKRLPSQLLLVVNKCTLELKPEALEQALSSPHGNQKSREAIRAAFRQRHFVVIPLEQLNPQAHQQALGELKKLVAQDGVTLHGQEISEMIQGLAVQLKDSGCNMASLHEQILQRFLRGQVEAVVRSFEESIGPVPVEYDPDFHVDISPKLDEFEAVIRSRNLQQEAAPFTAELRSTLEALDQKRRRVNDDLGNSTANWKDVLHRGCQLLASRRIGARIVVQRKQDLRPFLASADVVHVNPPVTLSIRWMWQHFHPQLNKSSHDFAVVLSQGEVVAVRVPAPPLPSQLRTPRGNARHKAALSVSLRSDAWVVVVSEERGEISVACAGELWDVGSAFPDDQQYEVHEQKRRSILMDLRLLWESRCITSSAHGRVHSLKEPWVWDGKARDESELSIESRHHKSKRGAKRKAEEELRRALQSKGIIWDFSSPCVL